MCHSSCMEVQANCRVQYMSCPLLTFCFLEYITLMWSFQGVFKGFLHFFKVSLNIPNELRDSLNQSLNINWTGIAYYILSTLHVHVCLVGPLWLILCPCFLNYQQLYIYMYIQHVHVPLSP
jgi:hypothetical protein